ncbi:MAG: hypothetical protein HUU20_01350 [Pirellulales bacterium]|nr:hypothetical protein [Pirellulales bacterium]
MVYRASSELQNLGRSDFLQLRGVSGVGGEDHDSDLNQSPKYTATVHWAQACRQPMHVVAASSDAQAGTVVAKRVQ